MKRNKIFFVFRGSRASLQGFSRIKTKQNQNIFQQISDRITWQTTSRSFSSRFHAFCRSTVQSHTTLVSEGLLDKKEWDKIGNDLIGKDSSWLNYQSSFQKGKGILRKFLFQVGPETDFAYVTGAISRFSLQLNS